MRSHKGLDGPAGHVRVIVEVWQPQADCAPLQLDIETICLCG